MKSSKLKKTEYLFLATVLRHKVFLVYQPCRREREDQSTSPQITSLVPARGNGNIQKYQIKCQDKGDTAARLARLSLAATVHILREMSVLLGVVDGRVTTARLGRAAPGSQLEGSNSACEGRVMLRYGFYY